MRISSDCLPILSRAFARHSCECRTSILKISHIRGKVVRHSPECDSREVCRINVHSMRMQRKSCVCLIVNLCHEIVENYSRTSLQLGGSNYHRLPQTTTDHHRLPQTTTDHTTDYHRPPQTTTNHFKNCLPLLKLILWYSKYIN